MTKPAPDGIITRRRDKKGTKTNASLLEEAFPLEYLRNGLNATKAYKAIKKTSTDITARTEGSRVLAKPNVRERINDLMAQAELTVEEAMRVHRRNMLQEKHLPTSQKAVETVYQLEGLIKTGESNGAPVNVGVFIGK